jgi:hypothetical protein
MMLCCFVPEAGGYGDVLRSSVLQIGGIPIWLYEMFPYILGCGKIHVLECQNPVQLICGVCIVVSKSYQYC